MSHGEVPADAANCSTTTAPPTTTSVIGPGEAIEHNGKITRQLDWEVELAVVMGRTARRVTEAEAMGFVFGYSVMIDVSAREHDGLAEVSVTDTGVGIATEDQEAVFEEFRQVGTADKKVEGTGLGLALARKFIELHGGRIWLKSQLGQGSTFTFALPVGRED